MEILKVLKEELNVLEELQNTFTTTLDVLTEKISIFRDVEDAETEYQNEKEALDIVLENYSKNIDVYQNKYIIMYDQPKVLETKTRLDNLKKNPVLSYPEKFWIELQNAAEENIGDICSKILEKQDSIYDIELELELY